MCHRPRWTRRTIPLAAITAITAIVATAAAHGQSVAPRLTNPGIWQPVPQDVVDTLSARALLRLHRRLVAHEDSLIGYGRMLLAYGVPWRRATRPPRGPLSTRAYASLVGVALLYNAACPAGRSACERDPGGYVDSYRSIDKLAHASSALALTSLTIEGGVRPRDAALVTFLGSVGFELTQAEGGGYYSARDVTANATGIATAWAWSAWVAHRRAAIARR